MWQTAPRMPILPAAGSASQVASVDSGEAYWESKMRKVQAYYL
jgi:hypothetical protein